MVGLLVCGLAVARRVGPVPGIVLCALAAGVKAPALLGAVFIGWCWPGPAAAFRARIERTVLALGIAGATLAVLSWISGLGWGWVDTISAESKVSTGVTPVDAVAHLVTDGAHLVGWQVGFGGVRVVFAVLGLAAAAAITAVLLWRSPRIGLVRALGLSLLAFALLGPVLWAWYATWGLVLLAPVATGRLRRAIIAITIVEAAHRHLRGRRHGSHAGVGRRRRRPAHRLRPRRGGPRRGPAVPRLRRRWSLLRTPWSGQRADQPAGVTVTAAQRPHVAAVAGRVELPATARALGRRPAAAGAVGVAGHRSDRSLRRRRSARRPACGDPPASGGPRPAIGRAWSGSCRR